MLTIKVCAWDGAEEVFECEAVCAVAETTVRGPGDEGPWTSERTVVCYFTRDMEGAARAVSNLGPPRKEPPAEGGSLYAGRRNRIYVMNDKGKTICTY